MPIGLHALVRRAHEERVLRALRERGALSRGVIAEQVGLSRTTLSEIISGLLQRGAITVVDTDRDLRTGSGRPAERLALDPASGQFMGVDFGHRRVQVAVADASHEVIASGSDRYADDSSWQHRFTVALDLIDRLGDDSGVRFGALQAIGIGLPGPYPNTVLHGHAGPGSAEDADSAGAAETVFADRFGAAVVVDNNTRFAALAEAIAAHGDSPDDLVYVRLSDGVGGGLVVGGRLVTGATGLAGELGHVTALPGGRGCRCGKRGCLETVASVPAILAECRARGAAVHTLEQLAAAVANGDTTVDSVLTEATDALGRVIAAAAMALNPAGVVVGGRITALAPVLVERVRAVVAADMFPGADAPAVRAARLSDDDGALGALAALFHSSPLLAGYPEPDVAPTHAVQPPR
ncbi:putative NBD/HSP70 family sugar kinase [Haloactinopolyspora alba]|uniref:Putative NBD/HSP70 family sugar kinase n=1 Tax=Haloactinopolyspora alba TaxID=648780 RepID=A0A2P8EB38_9ACTN|nr:ROK family transcriptional regulator [Haloactinopolyspora alba]PSL06683.1 putative NBD/HSP70 family sugar kinase [Haloactinopolyspora alba]